MPWLDLCTGLELACHGLWGLALAKPRLCKPCTKPRLGEYISLQALARRPCRFPDASPDPKIYAECPRFCGLGSPDATKMHEASFFWHLGR